MKIDHNRYPFSAIVGQEKVKKALLLSVINPKLGGVLLIGGKGLAKTTTVRAISTLLKDKEIIELPLNVSEDRLIGSFHLEKAIIEGEVEYEPGILAQANNQLLYVDEVNLLEDGIVNLLLDTVSSGELYIERELISRVVPAHFTLIGTMNPEEGELRGSLLDRFGLAVYLSPETDLNKRVEIMDRRATFEKNPKAFHKLYMEHQVALTENILDAIRLLPEVSISSFLLEYCSRLCLNYGVMSLRADLILVQTAKTIAALENTQVVTKQHVLEAAEFVLAHRGIPTETTEETEPQENESQNDQQDKEDLSSQERYSDPSNSNEQLGGIQASSEQNDTDKSSLTPEEEPMPDWLTAQLLQQIAQSMQQVQLQLSRSKKASMIAGQRAKQKSLTKKGRYRQATATKTSATDLAFDATLRAAAPYQRYRQKDGFAVVIEKEELRYKKRQTRSGATILFVVDISGSMGAKERIAAVRATLLNLLQDAYEKRDRVAVIAFRRTNAELVIPPTNSVELAFRQLHELPTGGKTPIAHALQLTEDVALQELKMHPDRDLHLVFVTDGKANVALHSKPVEDMLLLARNLSELPITKLVLDTEIQNVIQFGFASKLADAMQANYKKLEKINNISILNSINEQLRGSVNNFV